MPESSLPPPPLVSPWPRHLDALAALVVQDLAAAPGASVAVWTSGPGGPRYAAGACGHLAPGEAPVTPTSLFDLASVTKPYLALAAARLHRRRPFLDQPLGAFLQEARGTASEQVPIELFLAHRAGLDGHRPLYAPLLRGAPIDRSAALREAAEARRPGCEGHPPENGFEPVYSDLGYLLVGEAAARCGGSPLPELLHREVLSFSGGTILSARQIHQRGWIDLTAPTEVADFRGGLVRASVHDENAWAFRGLGVCGHAGLFGDAPSVAALGVLLLDALADRTPAWLRAVDLDPLLRARPGGTLRAGFDGKSDQGSSAGLLFHTSSFGHLGFTGTSLWVDPVRPLVVALLSNRVFPSRAAAAEQIKRARPMVHDAAVCWAEGG